MKLIPQTEPGELLGLHSRVWRLKSRCVTRRRSVGAAQFRPHNRHKANRQQHAECGEQESLATRRDGFHLRHGDQRLKFLRMRAWGSSVLGTKASPRMVSQAAM